MQTKIILYNTILDHASRFRYLRCDITCDVNRDVVVDNKFQLICGRFQEKRETRLSLNYMTAVPGLLCSSETWVPGGNTLLERIQASQMRFLLSVV